MNTYKNFALNFLTSIAVMLVVFSSPKVFAAELIFKVVPNIVSEATSTVIEVTVDPQSKNLNVVEGVLSFTGEASDKLDVSTDYKNSILSIWPTAPNYSSVNKSIQFTGGIPGGFDRAGLLMRLNISSTSYGNIMISWAGGTAYLNDGKGTKEDLSARSIKLNLGQQNSKNETSYGFAGTKNVTLFVILAVILFGVSFYVYKKIVKK